MFDFLELFGRKKRSEEYKDELLENVIGKIKEYHRINKFKSKIVLEYLARAYESNETIEELYQTIYLKNNENIFE
jgi:hypothetical protein